MKPARRSDNPMPSALLKNSPERPRRSRYCPVLAQWRPAQGRWSFLIL